MQEPQAKMLLSASNYLVASKHASEWGDYVWQQWPEKPVLAVGTTQRIVPFT